MPLTNENIKDLIPWNESHIKNFVVGGVFYRKEEDGSFSHCTVSEHEMKDPHMKKYLRELTMKYFKEGKLYIRKNKPWEPFNG